MPHAITPPNAMTTSANSRPANIGIKAIELYVPNTCVDQAALEIHDGVSPGKYTIGLGQSRMGFCDDREDIYSMTLTVVSSLMRKYNIDPCSIGRLEVGTETLLDKSKSVKSVLMQLFSHINNNIEGVDNINACYGGTNALLSAVNWVESSAWDGRNAIVVAGDVAIYGKGPARPTGGAGAVAMLIGPNAPVVLQPGLRGSFFEHTYDFYKPDLRSEYPVVHGQYSLECYTRVLDTCYANYKAREQVLASAAQKSGLFSQLASDDSESDSELASTTTDKTSTHKATDTAPDLITDRFDFMVFHSPTTKLVTKSYARLFYNDFKAHPHHPNFSDIDPSLLSVDYSDSLSDKIIEKVFSTLSKKSYAGHVTPSNQAPVMCGNMYTASLYSGLVSLLSNVAPEIIFGKTIGMFSYGSGLASTMFSLQVVGDTSQMKSLLDLDRLLDTRRVVDPSGYEEAIELRERAHMQKNFTPSGGVEHLVKGTYYLTGVDDQYRRSYSVA